MTANKKKAARFAVLATACAGMKQETDNPDKAALWEAMEGEFKKLGEDYASEDQLPGLEPTTIKATVAQAFSEVATEADPQIAAKFRETVLKCVSEALGDQVQPTRVSGVTPGYPPSVRPVYRAGQDRSAANPAANVPVEFAHLTAIDE